jgi:hypothetical protein
MTKGQRPFDNGFKRFKVWVIVAFSISLSAFAAATPPGFPSSLLVGIPNLTHEETSEVSQDLQALGGSGGIRRAERWYQTH